MDGRERKLHVVLLPWPAHGHASPFLELAKKLSDKGLQVSFCSTPIILNSLKGKLNGTHSVSVKLVELHLPTLPHLPPHYHTTTGLPPHLMPTLKQAYESSGPALCKILDSVKPDLLIHDIHRPSITDTPFCDIPLVHFVPAGAMVAAFFMHVSKKGDVEFPIPGIKLQGFHEKQFREILKNVSSESARKKAGGNPERKSDLLLLNTLRELEGEAIDYVQILNEIKTLPAGALIQGFAPEEDSETIKWLSEKEKSSTVFVSFGSEYFLSHQEREEVARGLELSGVNFIWVIRFSKGEEVGVEAALPEGFLERTRGRGLVVENWAPQAQILAHPSTGGFVSHCGWNSILESMACGIPIVAMPMHLDQPLNACLLEAAGVGLRVKRDDEDGRLDRDDISHVIRKVVEEESGEGIRRRAKEISDKIQVRGEAQIDEVVQELVGLCKRAHRFDRPM